jgi:hypothetical protein
VTEPTEPTEPTEGTGHGAAQVESARTGVPSVDAAAERLSELDDAPVEAHVGIYEDVHHRLQEGLADLDDQ